MRPLTQLARPAAVLRTALLTSALMGVGSAWAQQAPPPPGASMASWDYDAQQQPATRESVRADLIRLEQAGYNPNAEEATYPVLTQAAEARAYPPTRAQYAVADTGQGVRTYNASGTPAN